MPNTIEQYREAKANYQKLKIAVVEKRLASQKKKLEQALATGKTEKPIKDRIYELEDELRLAREK
jgi:flavorubredoxin